MNATENGIARVSLFPNSRATSLEDASVAEVAEMLSDPAGPLAALKERIRQADHADLAKIKTYETPAAAFTGVFLGGRRERDLSVPSGLVVLEAREHGGPVPEKSRRTLGPATALAFDSLGDRETKVVIAVEPHPTNRQQYEEAVRAAREYLEGLPREGAGSGRSRDTRKWPASRSSPTTRTHTSPDQDVEPVRWMRREENQEKQEYNSRLWETAVRMAHAEQIRPAQIQKVARQRRGPRRRTPDLRIPGGPGRAGTQGQSHRALPPTCLPWGRGNRRNRNFRDHAPAGAGGTRETQEEPGRTGEVQKTRMEEQRETAEWDDITSVHDEGQEAPEAPEVPEAAEVPDTPEAPEAPEAQGAGSTDAMNPMNTLEDVAGMVRSCTDCPLHADRTNAVPGEGPEDAGIMFIAEGPGANEDEQGRPFVGQAGYFLDDLLAIAGMNRSDVFITNMIKCRAPGNRDPEKSEMEGVLQIPGPADRDHQPPADRHPGTVQPGKVHPRRDDHQGQGQGETAERAEHLPDHAPGGRAPQEGQQGNGHSGLPGPPRNPAGPHRAHARGGAGRPAQGEKEERQRRQRRQRKRRERRRERGPERRREQANQHVLRKPRKPRKPRKLQRETGPPPAAAPPGAARRSG